jgi:transcription initiation factor IIE alpha subunit
MCKICTIKIEKILKKIEKILKKIEKILKKDLINNFYIIYLLNNAYNWFYLTYSI